MKATKYAPGVSVGVEKVAKSLHIIGAFQRFVISAFINQPLAYLGIVVAGVNRA